MRITLLLTCFNRIEKTRACIESLVEGADGLELQFIVVDDGSSDGTPTMLDFMQKSYGREEKSVAIAILNGGGKAYYSGGMRIAMEFAKANVPSDYYCLINDDVEFASGLLKRLETLDPSKVYVGAMTGNFDVDLNDTAAPDGSKCSYGGIRYTRGIHYEKVTPGSSPRTCDTFNANFVAIPTAIFHAVPTMDSRYIHSLGDFDYGLSIKKAGYEIEVLPFYAGKCANNSKEGTWMDTSLSRRERFKRKEDVKGAPFSQWFYFLKKNFGLPSALAHGFTPYLRILLGR